MDDYDNNINNNTPTSGPYIVANALITTAMDEIIYLNCVSILMRKEPNDDHNLNDNENLGSINDDKHNKDEDEDRV